MWLQYEANMILKDNKDHVIDVTFTELWRATNRKPLEEVVTHWMHLPNGPKD